MERKNINGGFKKLRVWQVEDPVFSGDGRMGLIGIHLLFLTIDGPAKSHFSRFSVIPAEAGIQ